MEDFDEIVFIRHAIRREKVFRDRYNPLESLNENEFMELYRLRKSTGIDLLKMGIGQANSFYFSCGLRQGMNRP